MREFLGDLARVVIYWPFVHGHTDLNAFSLAVTLFSIVFLVVILFCTDLVYAAFTTFVICATIILTLEYLARNDRF